MNSKLIATVSILSALGTAQAKAEILINEVMQSNVYCIMDDLNEFPDSWVELYNPDSAPVDIAGYRIGLKDKAAKAYELPAMTIEAGGYMLVYCDKAETGMHTDFRIDSGKGNVYLFNPAGDIIDEVSLKKQPAPDVAYGRKTDGASKWGYQLVPSPKAANTSGTTDTVLGEVTFSEPGGVWANSHTISLTLSLPDGAPEGAYIIYTLHGAEPTLDNSLVYSAPITISTSKVVRAKVVCDGCISRPSNAESYIFLGREMKIPVISIAVNPEYLYDKYIGIFADGAGGYGNENYRHDWRRPINLEYFAAPETASELNQLCETRVQGGYTRSNALKSMAMYANKRFGTKRFEYELWAKDKPGITDNKSFILRDGGNDYMWAYVRDGLMQRVIGRNTEIDWQGYAPAIIYINGKYHGMLAIRERSNEDNIAANYGGLEDIDMFENWHELKSGDMAAHDEFIEFIKTEHTFDEWQQMINIESYTNLMALNYWVYNTDFPHNNTVFWRRTDGVDGRWQWLVKDCDFGIGAWNSNDNLYRNFTDFLSASHPNEDPTGYDLWKRIMKCDEFKQYFINHMIAYTGDFLNASTFGAYLDEIVDENHGEQLISHNQWRNTSGAWWSDFNSNINFMHSWIKKRHSTMPSLMTKSFGLGSAVKVKVNTQLDQEAAESLHLLYDDVLLRRGMFDGSDFQGRTLTLEGAPEDNIVAWDVKVGNKAVERIDGAKLTLQLTTKNDYVINAVIDDSGIADVVTDPEKPFSVLGGAISATQPITVYDINGRQIAPTAKVVTLPAPGIYMVRTADGRTTSHFFR